MTRCRPDKADYICRRCQHWADRPDRPPNEQATIMVPTGSLDSACFFTLHKTATPGGFSLSGAPNDQKQ
jgi:hypothetical protein